MSNTKHTEGKIRIGENGNDIETDDSAALGLLTAYAYEKSTADMQRIVTLWNNFDAMKKQLQDNHTSLLAIYNSVQDHFTEKGLQQLRSDMKNSLDLLAKLPS